MGSDQYWSQHEKITLNDVGEFFQSIVVNDEFLSWEIKSYIKESANPQGELSKKNLEEHFNIFLNMLWLWMVDEKKMQDPIKITKAHHLGSSTWWESTIGHTPSTFSDIPESHYIDPETKRDLFIWILRSQKTIG